MKKQEIDKNTSNLILTQSCICIPLGLVYILSGIFRHSIALWLGVSDITVRIVGSVFLFADVIIGYIYLSKIRRSSAAFKIVNQNQSKAGPSNHRD